MKQYLKFYGWSILWILPLSLVFGLGQFNGNSIIMFTISSLGIPLALKAVPRLADQFNFSLHKGHYIYAWIWWNLFFFFGNGVLPFPLPKDPLLISGIWILTMLVVVALMIATAIGLDRWMGRRERYPFIDTVLNIGVYGFPVPLLFLGDVMYLDLNDPVLVSSLTQAAFIGLQMSLFLGLIALVANGIGAIVFYLYPRRTQFWPRIASIVVTSIFWVATNAHILFGGYIPDFVKVWAGYALPAFQGSFLVYVTPAIFEVAALALSLAIGLGIEKLWLSKASTSSSMES